MKRSIKTLLRKPLGAVKRRVHLPASFRTKKVRVAAAVVAVVVVLPSILLVLTQAYQTKLYQLPKTAQSVIDTSSVDTKLIKQQKDSITYNRAFEDSPKELQQMLTAAASKQDSTGQKPYQASLNLDPKKGISFSDSSSDNNITMTPRFTTASPALMNRAEWSTQTVTTKSISTHSKRMVLKAIYYSPKLQPTLTTILKHTNGT